MAGRAPSPIWAAVMILGVLVWIMAASSGSEPAGDATPAEPDPVPTRTVTVYETVTASPPAHPTRSRSEAAKSSTTTTSSYTSKLQSLKVGAEGHGSSYDRDAFGGWIDADGDCQDSRAEVLRAESKVSVSENSNCTVQTGKWFSLYDGVTVTTASGLDIDHVVPLAETWRSGGWAWGSSRLRAYSNDLNHRATLRAVTAHTNRSKGDRDPSDWLPPSRASWCRYAKDWVDVKLTWGLSAQRAEVEQLGSMLASC